MTPFAIHFLAFLAGLFTTARGTFFTSGCFGMHCFTSTQAPPRPLPFSLPALVAKESTGAVRRTGTGLRTVLAPNFEGVDDRIYGRSGKPMTRNRFSKPDQPSRKSFLGLNKNIGLPVNELGISVGANVNLCADCVDEQIGPLSEQYNFGYQPHGLGINVDESYGTGVQPWKEYVQSRPSLKLEDSFEVQPWTNEHIQLQGRPTVQRVVFPSHGKRLSSHKGSKFVQYTVREKDSVIDSQGRMGRKRYNTGPVIYSNERVVRYPKASECEV